MEKEDTVRATGDVAIIGMSCVFPGAADLQTYWQNIVSKVDAITDPPEDWEADLFYDPDSHENDRIYCKRGGYLGDLASFDPLKYGVMPNSVDGGEPDHFLALRVAHEALADAGYLERTGDGERVEVILGRGTYINRGYTTLIQHGLVVDQTLRILKQLHPEHTKEELQEIRQELKASLPPFNAENAPGLVPNIVSGRIANRLNFMGPNYTVDAACASSLIAVDRGMHDLLGGTCDLAIVGGVHASTPAPILMIFCQLNALSRRGQIRPFDENADGTLLGEGVGMIVLKRRKDAERDGDRIYALLKGIGTASDGRALGLLAPRIEGEELALKRAYEATDISPRSVGLIEAHGTGTPVGDLTEIQALKRVFGQRNGEIPTCGVGSVKSMISHLIPAAGIAGIIKVAMALYQKVLPPTLNCDRPNLKLEIDKTPFYFNTEARPWIHGSRTPRRAGVNAFGFGGINAHAILEEYCGASEAEVTDYQDRWETEVVVLQGESRQDLIQQCQTIKNYLSKTPQIELKDLAYTLNSQLRESSYRLAIVASDLTQLEEKLAHAVRRLMDRQCVRIKDVSGIYFFEETLGQQGKLAFLFPGEGAQYVNMLSDLCMHFPEVRSQFDLVDQAFSNHHRNYVPSQIIFPPPPVAGTADSELNERRLWQMDCGPEAVFTANQALFALLTQLQIRPQAVLGHSTGEYSALYNSGAIEIEKQEQLIQQILEVNGIYERLLADDQIPEGGLVTVGAVDRDFLLALIEESNGFLQLAMDNCPHQGVICGTPAALEKAIELLRSKGAICASLPFNRPYHTELFKTFAEHLEGFFRRLKIVSPRIKMYSCMTTRPYPEDSTEIRRLAVEQWARPVRFQETIKAMYEDGVRIFVEVGPKGNLTSFVNDILRGRSYLAVASNVVRHSGITQLNHLVALLAAHGVPMQLDHLYARRTPRKLSFEEATERNRSVGEERSLIRLSLGLQPLRLKRERANGRSDLNNNAPVRGLEKPQTVSNLELASPARSSDSVQDPPSNLPAQGPQEGGNHHGQNGLGARVVNEYLHTMESFLKLQQEVMQAFLGGNGHTRSNEITVTTAESPLSLDGLRQQPMTESPVDDTGPSSLESSSDRVDHCASRSTEGTLTSLSATEVVTPESSRPSRESIEQILLTLISERTGYPIHMLGLTQNLEADLGVDSIKRVEILGAFQKQTGLFQAEEIERVTGLKTAEQIVDLAVRQNSTQQGASSLSQFHAVTNEASPASPSNDQTTALPFVGSPTSFVAGKELVTVREIDVTEDIFLRDHTLGGSVSVNDETLVALPIVPLTISIEMMAEVAAVLFPGKLVLGLKNIRAYRWISLESGRTTLQLVARCKTPSVGEEIEVQINEASQTSAGEAKHPLTLVEGTVILGECYPEQPATEKFVLRSERPSTWAPEQLYTKGMFHGPRLQGVVSVDRWGEDGTTATLKGLPSDQLFRSIPEPQFLTDPVLLDAAGQLVGYWTAEHLETGFNVFPFAVEAVHLYGSGLPRGEVAECRARIALVGPSQVRSDIDIIGPGGQLHAQLVGWEDKRFNLPDSFYRLRISPRDALLSTSWSKPFALFPQPESFFCCLLEDLPNDLLETHGKIWQLVLAHLVLNRTERELWQNFKGPERRRNDWLRGRSAAKDAVRLLLRNKYGLQLCPADIEITQDEHGRPRAQGRWIEDLECEPIISLAHSDGLAVAVAGDATVCDGIGVDVERLGRTREGFEIGAFTSEERNLLSEQNSFLREEQAMRLWCAKEAVAKSLGRGLIGGPRGLLAQRLDADTGIVELIVSGAMAKELPELIGTNLRAFTLREGDLIVASSLWKRS